VGVADRLSSVAIALVFSETPQFAATTTLAGAANLLSAVGDLVPAVAVPLALIQLVF
jgi:hypothetical protein